jgi:ribonuclease BN (tRNA processing enzyme)
MEVRLLGSGGFMPSDRRETCCVLLRKDGHALAIDAGSGARRLVQDRELLRGVERLYVVLTHFHLDHTHGLFYLVDAEPPVEVWAAGRALEGVATETLLGRLLGTPFAPSGFLDVLRPHELPLGEAQLGPFALRTRVQTQHSNPTLAVRVDESVAWCTDTAYDEGNVDFVRGAGILFHEAFTVTSSDGTHTAAADAARLAAAAEVDRLVLIHVDPALADEGALLTNALAHFEGAELGHDGWTGST